MSALTIGNQITFNYLKGSDVNIVRGILTKDYSAKAKQYTGTVVAVRDIEKHPISNTTARYGQIQGHRSQNLYSVELEDGAVQSFYGGRMIGVEPVAKRAVKGGLLQTMKNLLSRTP